MDYNIEKVDEVVLALLFLTSFKEQDHHRSWKGHDWDALDRLYEKGFISDPKNKSKSVLLTQDGFKKAKDLFQKYFHVDA